MPVAPFFIRSLSLTFEQHRPTPTMSTVADAHPELYARGDFMCVMTPRKQANKYGILVNNVPRGAEWGTCIMYDPKGSEEGNKWGTIQTFGHKALKLAWDRVNNKDETSPYKKDVPVVALRCLLAQGLAQDKAFYAAITASEQSFAAALASKTNARQKAAATRLAASKRKPATSKPFPMYMKNPEPFPIGTKVSAHFQWNELYISKADGVA